MAPAIGTGGVTVGARRVADGTAAWGGFGVASSIGAGGCGPLRPAPWDSSAICMGPRTLGEGRGAHVISCSVVLALRGPRKPVGSKGL